MRLRGGPEERRADVQDSGVGAKAITPLAGKTRRVESSCERMRRSGEIAGGGFGGARLRQDTIRSGRRCARRGGVIVRHGRELWQPGPPPCLRRAGASANAPLLT